MDDVSCFPRILIHNLEVEEGGEREREGRLACHGLLKPFKAHPQ